MAADLNAQTPRPSFNDYPVKEIYRGQPAPPIITKEARWFRTRIREGARSDVQFAGHYTIPAWGCGADCIMFVVVDSVSGRVYNSGFSVVGLPFTWLDEHENEGEKMQFHPNSRLLKINACPNEENCGQYDYVMIDGKGLKLIRRQLLPAEFQPPPVFPQDSSQNHVASAPLSTNPANQAKSGSSLPAVFISVLPDVKAKSRVPVLLPSELPEPIGRATHAVQEADAGGYGITLYFKLGVGDSGFAANFSGDATPKYSPRELPNVAEVELAHSVRGFFRPISCGGSCAPVNLWWEDGGILYQIQLRLSSAVSEEDQEKTIEAVANSAILAGPR